MKIEPGAALALKAVIENDLRIAAEIRHSYDFGLDAGKLRALWERWQDGSENVLSELRDFAATLAK